MKKSILFIVAILYFIMILCYGQTCCITNSVKVQGMGETRIPPNIAILYTSVTEDGSTIQNALYSINTSLDRITSGLQQISVNLNDISTSSISVYPKYNYTDGKSYLVGFTVYLSLTVTIRGIENKSSKIGQVMDSLARDGAVSMSGITYDTQDPNSGKTQARNTAYNDALIKAKQYAQLTGRTLGKVIIVQQTSIAYTSFYSPAESSLVQRLSVSQQKINYVNFVKSQDTFPDIPIGTILIVVMFTMTWQFI